MLSKSIKKMCTLVWAVVFSVFAAVNAMPMSAYALTQSQEELIECLGNAAQRNYAKYRILPSMTVAQAILESGWGSSSLSKLYYNYFGMKAGSNYSGETVTLKTGEEVNGVKITVNGTFRVYHSFDEGIEGYYQFITGYKRYSNLIDEKDYKEACRKIKEDGWATDSAYTNKLIKLIESYELTRFDPEPQPQNIYFQPCDAKFESLVDALNSIGVDSTKANRARIASANGISNYSYSAEQNVYMLDLLKSGSLINPDKVNNISVSMEKPVIYTTNDTFNINEKIDISWQASSEQSELEHYWLIIDGPQGRILNETMNRNTSYSFIPKESGTYTIITFATPYNSPDGSGSLEDRKTIIVTEQLWYKQISPIKLEDDFYARVKNISSGLYLTDTGSTIAGRSDTGGKEQIFRFEFQSDGSYKIISQSDGYPLDVAGGEQANGTDVRPWSEDNGTAAQRFYIYNTCNSYYIRPLCADKPLDMSLNDEEHNVAVWDYGYNWEPQKFVIETVSEKALDTNAATTTTTTTSTTTTVTSCEPTETSKSTETEKINIDILYGDANCDGDVSMADAVLIMQTLSNPDKYTISKIGILNADIDGNGVTNMDALTIQKMLLGLI